MRGESVAKRAESTVIANLGPARIRIEQPQFAEAAVDGGIDPGHRRIMAPVVDVEHGQLVLHQRAAEALRDHVGVALADARTPQVGIGGASVAAQAEHQLRGEVQVVRQQRIGILAGQQARDEIQRPRLVAAPP